MELPALEGVNLLDGATAIHFVGIGGIGMSALARVLHARGKAVSGSDTRPSGITAQLASTGARVTIGHTAAAVGGADLVVMTSAAREDNPELVEARRRGIPVVKRAEVLGWLMDRSYGLAVAGTHGKTTTTAMLAFVLHRAGLDPTAFIGGEPLDFESHGLLGRGPYLVAEADEFDRSFLRLWSKVAIITSVEADHLDCYKDLDDITEAFAEFAARVPPDGLLVSYSDDPVLAALRLRVPRQSYGWSGDADWRLLECTPVSPFGTKFRFVSRFSVERNCTLRLSGRHYALDALAVIAAARHVGVDPRLSAEILGDFRGTRRRYELIGQEGGVTVVDDYAHHPTAAKGTLEAASERHRGDIWCVFQPHTVNRTEKLFAEFSRAFEAADHLVLLPIYQPAGREEPSIVTSKDLLEATHHRDGRHAASLEEAASMLAAEVRAGDMVLTMGAGDVNRVGEMLLGRLREPAK